MTCWPQCGGSVVWWEDGTSRPGLPLESRWQQVCHATHISNGMASLQVKMVRGASEGAASCTVRLSIMVNGCLCVWFTGCSR